MAKCILQGILFIILLGGFNVPLVSRLSLWLRAHVNTIRNAAPLGVVHEVAMDDRRKSWDILQHHAKSSGYKLYSCRSISYQKHVDILPPLHLDELMLPPGTRTLFYGHSFLMEIVLNIIYAHSAQDENKGFQTRVQNLQVRCNRSAVAGCGIFAKVYRGHARRFRFRNNVEIVSVINHGLLQNDTSSVDAFAEFMTSYGPFDQGIFMKPHPPCFFRYWEQRSRVRKTGCVKLSNLSTGYSAQQLWEVMAKRVPMALEVVAWHGGADEHCAPEAQLIYAAPTLRQGCATADHSGLEYGDCAPVLYGHQCIPGRLTLVARDLVRRLSHR